MPPNRPLILARGLLESDVPLPGADDVTITLWWAAWNRQIADDPNLLVGLDCSPMRQPGEDPE